MKILVGIPTYRGKDYCWIAFLANLRAMKWAGHQVDFFVVDNSADASYAHYIRSFGLECRNHAPKERVQHTLAVSHNLIRQKCLEGKYDYLVHWESDIFPPSYAFEDLLALQAPVATGLYFLNFGLEHNLCLCLLGQIGKELSWNEVDRQHLGSYVTGEIREVYAAGLGFALIHRSVLQKISFRHEPTSNHHPDMFFYHDLFKLRIPALADTGLLIPHRNQDWQANYRFLKTLVDKD